MTLQASLDPSGGMQPPSFDFGALFRWRRPGEPRWKYEPPSLKKEESPEHSSDSAVSTPSGSSPRTAPASTFRPSDTKSNHFSATHFSSKDVLDDTSRRGYDNQIFGLLEGEEPLSGTTATSPAYTGQFHGLVAEEDSSLRTSDSASIDVNACLEKFQKLIADSAADLCEQSHGYLLRSYLACCPAVQEAGTFCHLVFEHLRNVHWPKGSIVKLFCEPEVHLPSIYGPDGLLFLRMMEEDYLADSNERSRDVYLVYKRLAEQIQATSPSSSSAQETRLGLLLRGPHFQDTNESLRLLIRGLWDSASWESAVLSTDVEQLLRKASYRLSDQRLQRFLRKTWKVLSMDFPRAPLRLVNLVVACVKDDSMIPVGVDFLQMMPASILRGWTASMPFTLQLKESQADSHLSSQTLLKYLNFQMWFKLLYRVDMRNNVATECSASLCQFAFTDFADRYFKQQRYPPITLIIALVYRLLGHDSLAGKSPELFDLIGSYMPSLVQQHQRGAALNSMLARLIRDLGKASLPNHGVLELVIPHIDEHKSFHSVSNLLERIAKTDSKLSSTTFLAEYTERVRREVSKETHSTRLGFNVAAFNRLLDAQLNLGVDDTIQRASIGEVQSRRFFQHILSRANDAHIVPLRYRSLTPDIPKEVQADLVHQFASQYAMDRTRSLRQNWRSIRYLYLYLKIHGLPIRPMFTQTVVNVCIVRPLAEKKFVGMARAHWVCRLVARVEGEEAARQVEQFFWVWRGDLIRLAKSKLVELGVYDLAHVSTMERLQLLPKGPLHQSAPRPPPGNIQDRPG